MVAALLAWLTGPAAPTHAVAAGAGPAASTAMSPAGAAVPWPIDSLSLTSPPTSTEAVPVAAAELVRGCVGPDIRCGVGDGVGNVVDAVTHDIDLPDPGDLIENPLSQVGEAIAKAAADAWTSAMLALWDAGLFVLRVVLNLTDSFLTPDLSEGGPGREVYAYTLWTAGAFVLVMAMIQLGLVAFRRDGKSLATMLIGTAQFVVVWSAWIGYCVIMVTACGGLTRALMKALLGVNSWPEWDPWSDFSSDDVTDATVATVLGLLGMVLWLAAIGHLLVLLTRAAALIILAATGAISAAGLVSDAGRSWFWKSLRWFHAAALTPVIMVLVLGIGVQLATGVANGLTDTTQQAVGTALPAVVLICISCLAPLALFKLLAFVDPGTPSGASVRAGLADVGGIQGLLSGSNAGAGGGSGGASAGNSFNSAAETDSNGRSAGESGAEDDTSARFTKSMTGAASGATSALGPVGAALGAGARMVANIGAKAASIGADVSNQMGVGHNGYQPDFSGIRLNRAQANGAGSNGEPQRPSGEGTPGGESDTGSTGGYAGGPDRSSSLPAGVPTPATVGAADVPGAAAAARGDAPAGARGAGGAGGASGASGGAAAAGGAVPPVAV